MPNNVLTGTLVSKRLNFHDEVINCIYYISVLLKLQKFLVQLCSSLLYYTDLLTITKWLY